MAIATVSTKGQLVIPAIIRKALGITPRSKVRIVLSEGRKAATLEPMPDDPIQTLHGIFQNHPGSLTDALLKDRKEDKALEEKKLARFVRHHGNTFFHPSR